MADEVDRTNGDERPTRWDSLVPGLVHPIKVAIIEALGWMDQPLSSGQLTKLFRDNGEEKDWTLNLISYHVRSMWKKGILEVTSERRVRGTTETFYFFPDTD